MSNREYTVEAILNSRKIKGRKQYLVKWEGYSHAENTWEPVANLANAKEAIKAFEQTHATTLPKTTADCITGEVPNAKHAIQAFEIAEQAIQAFPRASKCHFEFWNEKHQTWFHSACNDELLAHLASYIANPSRGSVFEFDDGNWLRTIDFNAPHFVSATERSRHSIITQMNISSRVGMVRPMRLVIDV
jgi:hypothetical protein